MPVLRWPEQLLIVSANLGDVDRLWEFDQPTMEDSKNMLASLGDDGGGGGGGDDDDDDQATIIGIPVIIINYYEILEIITQTMMTMMTMMIMVIGMAMVMVMVKVSFGCLCHWNVRMFFSDWLIGGCDWQRQLGNAEDHDIVGAACNGRVESRLGFIQAS